MPDIRLVALDLDGTVFNDEKEITPRTLEAIRAAIAKGVDVIPATGRVASGVPEAFLRIPGVRYALTSNGASVVELSTGKPLVNLPFDAALASDIYDIVAATGGAMGIFIGGKAYTDYFGANDGLALMPPALRRYLRDGNIRLFQKHFRLEDFIVIEIFVYGHRIFVRKKFVEIILRNARLFGYFFHADGVGVVLRNVFRGFAQILDARKRMEFVLLHVIVRHLR